MDRTDSRWRAACSLGCGVFHPLHTRAAASVGFSVLGGRGPGANPQQTPGATEVLGRQKSRVLLTAQGLGCSGPHAVRGLMHLLPGFTAALLQQPGQKPKCPMRDERGRCGMQARLHARTHTHTVGCYSVIRVNGFSSFATMWMKLECILLYEVSQAEKDKYLIISLTRGT